MRVTDITRGYRRKVLDMIVMFGYIPKKGFHNYQLENKRMYQRALRKLYDEGYVDSYKPYGMDRVYYLIESEELYKALGEEYKERYEKQKDFIRRYRKSDRQKQERSYITVDSKLYMYKAGVEIESEEEPLYEVKKIEGNNYYPSTEIKASTEYEDKIVIENGNKKVIPSKSVGIAVLGKKGYTVYNIGERVRSMLYPSNEERYRVYMEGVLKARGIVGGVNAIMIGDSWMNVAEVITNDFEKGYITTVYRSIYAFTRCVEDVILLGMLKEEGYEEKIKKSVLKEYEIESAKNTRVACDGYNEETGVYSLVYCMPDIKKLRLFANATCLSKDKTKYKVYCYKHQIQTVISMCGKNATILAKEIV